MRKHKPTKTMNFNPSIFLLISIITLSCHRVNPKAETEVSKPDTVPVEMQVINSVSVNTVAKTDSGKAEVQKFDTISESITGDFNGDGTKEKAWFYYPNRQELAEYYNGSDPVLDAKYRDNPKLKNIYVRFSNPQIPSIKIKEYWSGVPVNEGDLNGDGADEIGSLLDWWIGGWLSYHVYTFRTRKWILAVEPISIFWSDYYEKKIDVIRKDPKNSGYVIINYSEVNDDFVVKTKSVPIK